MTSILRVAISPCGARHVETEKVFESAACSDLNVNRSSDRPVGFEDLQNDLRAVAESIAYRSAMVTRLCGDGVTAP